MTSAEWEAWLDEALERERVRRFEAHLRFWLDAAPDDLLPYGSGRLAPVRRRRS